MARVKDSAVAADRQIAASHNALKSASEELKDALREHVNTIQQARRELAQEKVRLNLESTPIARAGEAWCFRVAVNRVQGACT